MHGLQIISGDQTGQTVTRSTGSLAKAFVMAVGAHRSGSSRPGPIPLRYELRENTTADYLQRTQRNIKDSNGTVIFTVTRRLQGGTLATAQFALESGKSCLNIHVNSARAA